MKPTPPSTKAKSPEDSAAREEYADAAAMVAELMACDAYSPTKLVRRGLWRHMGHWFARAALLGGGSGLLIGLTGPFGVVVLAGLVVPYATVASVGSHLDQFRGDRPMRLGVQLERWWTPAARLWPVAFVYLLLCMAFGILASMHRADVGARLVAAGGIAFVALAWTESVAFQVLRGGELPDAVGAGIQRAGRRLARYPAHLLRHLTFRGREPGEGHLLTTWCSTGLWTVMSGLIAWLMIAGLAEAALGPFLQSGLVELALYLAAGTAAWHSFEAGVGTWVHHYLAHMAEERGLVSAARSALEEEAGGPA